MGLGTIAVAAMKRLAAPAAFALALAGAAPASAQGKVTPLFAEDAPLDVVISGPIRGIVRTAERSTDPHPATISVNGETLAIDLAARGISRRRAETCRFPPLSIDFTTKPEDTSLFDGQNKLKLVTHCQNGGKFGTDQFVLKEYAAYRLFNRITDKSLRVRLARVRYMDDGKEVDQRWAFFIEDIDDAARRLGGKEVDVISVPGTVFNHADGARYAIFQYMIGNLDFAMEDGPGEAECCHNSKLIGATKEARSDLTPVPYDFDYAGLVDAPYALPPESIPVRKVTQRYYRGFCAHNDEAQQFIPEYLAARPALEAELGAIPGLEPRTRDGMVRFLAGFFEDIATPAAVEKNLFKTCRSGG